MAQEREKRRIVLASILKPLDDTRMTGKLGTTLAISGYSVTVIGYASSGPLPPGLTFQSLGSFRRLGIRRWMARWKAFRFAFAGRPDIFIFSTYELILPALLLKVILGTRTVYDVRENYYRNIRHSEGLPALLRWPLAVLVRGIEKLTAPMMDHFFLAEKGYEEEFRFHRGGWTVLENKAVQGPRRTSDKPRGLNLLFTGTLSESTGVFRAIRLAENLHKVSQDVTLTVAGYAAASDVQRKIRQETTGKSFIHLVGIESLVPHGQILSLVSKADAGILAYRKLPHTANSVPTKLFEYLQASLPIVAESDWPWIPRFAACSPFVFADLENPNSPGIINTLKTNTFYPVPAEGVTWSSEEPKLLTAIKNIV